MAPYGQLGQPVIQHILSHFRQLIEGKFHRIGIIGILLRLPYGAKAQRFLYLLGQGNGAITMGLYPLPVGGNTLHPAAGMGGEDIFLTLIPFALADIDPVQAADAQALSHLRAQVTALRLPFTWPSMGSNGKRDELLVTVEPSDGSNQVESTLPAARNTRPDGR